MIANELTTQYNSSDANVNNKYHHTAFNNDKNPLCIHCMHVSHKKDTTRKILYNSNKKPKGIIIAIDYLIEEKQIGHTDIYNNH